jgi:amidophosphoribosyltransferase
LTNADELKRDIYRDDRRHLNTESDSEVLLNIFAHELQMLDKMVINEKDIFAAVARVHKRCRGAYAVVAMITDYGIVAFRDPNGIRPLVFGCRESEKGIEYMVASESVAIDAAGFELQRDVLPGEAIYIDMKGKLHRQKCVINSTHTPCIFEHVYFARPDSIMDGISVYKSRLRMGERLARKMLRDWPDHDIDVVIPIPDTSRTSALQLANEIGVVYREGFIKNRYIGRTFIMPGQQERKKSVRQKLNAIDLEFRGKNVLLVDDSIVRGTTSKQIIMMAREAGAKKVYFASASPPVRHPNVYGIDMPAATELIAHNRNEDEIAKTIGADKVIYQDLEDLVKAVQKGNPDIAAFDTSVFSGEYITADVTADYLEQLELLRSDAAKGGRESAENGVIDMYNNN